MSKLKKALDRLQSKPADFTWDELRTVMESMGYELKMGGGSGRKFIHPATRATLFMHQPHPRNLLKAYQVREAIRFLQQERHIA